MISILGPLISILFLPFSFLFPHPHSHPPAPSTLAPAPTDKELTVTRWEESCAPLPDPHRPTDPPPAPAGQPIPQGPAAPLSDPSLTLGRAPSAQDQVTP